MLHIESQRIGQETTCFVTLWLLRGSLHEHMSDTPHEDNNDHPDDGDDEDMMPQRMSPELEANIIQTVIAIMRHDQDT